MFVELAVIVSIAICIIYCKKLETKIKNLQDSKNSFAKLIQEFDLATERAEAGINELNKMSIKTQKQTNRVVERAKSLINDLNFASDMAENMNKKIEQNLQEVRIKDKLSKNNPPYINDFKESSTRNNIQNLINKISKPSYNDNSSEDLFSNNKTYNIFRKIL